MTDSSYLAYDLGAESGRAILGRLRDDRLEIREVGRFPNAAITVEGHMHWDVFRLFEEMKACLARCAKEADPMPGSIGLDTWGVDFALLDGSGKILGLPYCYRDDRTAGAMDSFFRKVPRDEVYGRTGIQFLKINTLFQLESMVRDASPLLEAASDLLFMPDLFHYLLAGVKRTEFTFATTSQLYNPVKQGWDDELLAALGLDRSLMQEVVASGTVLGHVGPEICEETGFPGVPVVAAATHDTGSAVAAVPAEGDDWAFISSGTWSLMGVESAAPVLTDGAREANFTNEGGVGGRFRLLKNIMGLWLLQQCRRTWSTDGALDYDELTAVAASAPPFAALVDPDDPVFLNPPDMPAAIAAYCLRTGQEAPATRGATARCVLESIALKYRRVLDQLRNLHGRPIRRIHVIGGGSRNRLLCRFTADATGLPVLAGPVEATALGNLLVQAMAVGDVASTERMREIVDASFPMERFDPESPEEWDPVYDRFMDLGPV